MRPDQPTNPGTDHVPDHVRAHHAGARSATGDLGAHHSGAHRLPDPGPDPGPDLAAEYRSPDGVPNGVSHGVAAHRFAVNRGAVRVPIDVHTVRATDQGPKRVANYSRTYRFPHSPANGCPNSHSTGNRGQ